jgi:hypothetical protein
VGNTIVTGGQILPNLVYNGIGGEWTLLDGLSASSIRVLSGKLIDNGNNLYIQGDIVIAPIYGLLESSGIWNQTANGVVSNPSLGSQLYPSEWCSNRFNEYVVSDGASVTITGANQNSIGLLAKKIQVVENSEIIGSSQSASIAYPQGNDFLNIETGSDIVGLPIRFYLDHDSEFEQKAIDVNAGLYINYSHSTTIKMTGDWHVDYLVVFGGTGSDSEAEAVVLDTNGHNLEIDGDLRIGNNLSSYPNSYFGKILLRDGDHKVGNNLYVYYGAYGSRGYLDLGSSKLSVMGDLDFREAVVTAVAGSEVNLNGTSRQDILLNNNIFYNLNINNVSGEGVLFKDSGVISGEFICNNAGANIFFTPGISLSVSDSSVNGSSSNSIKLLSSVAGEKWYISALNSGLKFNYVDVQDSDASGGEPIDASEGGFDLGNNSNWIFPGIYTVSVQPDNLTIKPGESHQFNAKAYNRYGRELTGKTFSWSLAEQIGVVDGSGKFTAGTNLGTYSDILTVESDGVKDSANITITRADDVVPARLYIEPDYVKLRKGVHIAFKATVYDTENRIIENAKIAWDVVDASGRIDANGIYTAGQEVDIYKDSIKASYGNFASYATVQIEETKEQIKEEEDDSDTLAPVSIDKPNDSSGLLDKVVNSVPAKVIPLAVSAAAAVASIATGSIGVLSAQLATKDYVLIFINYLLSIFSFKKRDKYGLVFNSATQKPLSGALIQLYNYESMRLIAATLTDKNGRYLFTVAPGKYIMSVIKPGYSYPSKNISPELKSENYMLGQIINIDNMYPIINKMIPVDPSEICDVKAVPLFKLLSSRIVRYVILLSGSALAVYSLVMNQSLFNYVLCSLYLLIFIIELMGRLNNISMAVVKGENNRPLALAAVRLVAENGKLLETFVSDWDGRVLPRVDDPSQKLIITKSQYESGSFQPKNAGIIEKVKFVLRKKPALNNETNN